MILFCILKSFSFPEISIANCVFPFIYGGEFHYSCISDYSDFDWCSLDFQFQGRWRYCTALGKSPTRVQIRLQGPREERFWISERTEFRYCLLCVIWRTWKQSDRTILNVFSTGIDLSTVFLMHPLCIFSADPPMCVFPFQFRKKTVNECTKEGYILNRSWCSLTNNYNKDRKWKQCSPHK